MTPRVLVISNECFSKTSSNGRTLGNFLVGWPKECLAQFYLTGTPDGYYCGRYFQVSDKQALNALMGKNDVGGVIHVDIQEHAVSPNKNAVKKTARNALTMLCRELIWSTNRWNESGYWKWIDDYKPEVVLLQAGDCGFMFRIALKTTKRYNAKLVIYNSEGYYYKDFDYFRGKGLAHFFYPVFRKQLRSALEAAYSYSDCVIYICDELKERYAQDFKGRAETVFTGSEITYQEKSIRNDVFTTVYCGNLGLKRHESLIEIANALQGISPEFYVDVYGKANDDVKEAFGTCKGIRYHGMVPYERVKEILRDSDLLLYVESFDPFYQEDIKFGFSTKIADSLSSGNCFLLYAPEHFACYQYLSRNQAAYTASTSKELKEILCELCSNPQAREKYRETALEMAARNHNIELNNSKFQKILRETVS